MKVYILYLLKNILKYFILILFTLTIIIWITRTIRYVYFITEYGIDLKTFILIITLILPDLLIFSIPISTFLAIIFLYNKLIKNNEMVILQNAGVGKSGFLFPPFVLSLIVMFCLYSITLYLSPKSNRIFEEQKEEIRNNMVNVLLNNTNFNNFQNITFYAKERDGNSLSSIVFYFNDEKTDKILYAKDGKINNTIITFNDGNMQEFDNDLFLRVIYFDKYSIDISKFYKIDYTTYEETSTMFLKDLLKIEEKNNEVKVEIFNKIFFPFLSITLSILASLLVLNNTFSRFENNKDIFISYFICLINFVFFIYFVKLGKKNIIFLFISFLSLFTPLFYLLFNYIKKKQCLKIFLQKE